MNQNIITALSEEILKSYVITNRPFWHKDKASYSICIRKRSLENKQYVLYRRSFELILVLNNFRRDELYRKFITNSKLFIEAELYCIEWQISQQKRSISL